MLDISHSATENLFDSTMKFLRRNRLGQKHTVMIGSGERGPQWRELGKYSSLHFMKSRSDKRSELPHADVKIYLHRAQK